MADGSSPLARGTHAPGNHGLSLPRFIPARAGNTHDARDPPLPVPVHPRSRGEHAAHLAAEPAGALDVDADRGSEIAGHATLLPYGSDGRTDRRAVASPRMAGDARGRLLLLRLPAHRLGPARTVHAHRPGLTHSPRSRRSRRSRHTRSASRSITRRPPSRVHPRSRGEHGGSGGDGGEDLRFIPARAGNTPAAETTGIRIPVHPRSRGEHGRGHSWVKQEYGSSPLARGTRRPRPGLTSRTRFISARAGNTGSPPRTATTRPVHPRSRGEHARQDAWARHARGSSPLARGTPTPPPPLTPQERFIPARAGNTRRRPGPRPARPVHPRSRGEHAGRGGQGEARRRFIPARAGNTISPGARGTRTPVHPRSRGEHSAAAPPPAPCPPAVHPRSRGEHGVAPCPIPLRFGSSPLARGTLSRGDTVPMILRFIPARAGNTSFPAVTLRVHSVHPRSRGEHVETYDTAAGECGSSPLARGTPRDIHDGVAGGRFIPARAGNTAPLGQRGRNAPVHPRSRGEHGRWQAFLNRASGSSPLARGTRVTGRERWLRRRFIPARAGNTGTGRWPRRQSPVHPRSRGEHAHLQALHVGVGGSSPLARGTRPRRASGRRGRRFIPARAGNTRTSRRCMSVSAVHPRSRGEHGLEGRAAVEAAGSSPLARGTPPRR